MNGQATKTTDAFELTSPFVRSEQRMQQMNSNEHQVKRPNAVCYQRQNLRQKSYSSLIRFPLKQTLSGDALRSYLGPLIPSSNTNHLVAAKDKQPSKLHDITNTDYEQKEHRKHYQSLMLAVKTSVKKRPASTLLAVQTQQRNSIVDSEIVKVDDILASDIHVEAAQVFADLDLSPILPEKTQTLQLYCEKPSFIEDDDYVIVDSFPGDKIQESSQQPEPIDITEVQIVTIDSLQPPDAELKDGDFPLESTMNLDYPFSVRQLTAKECRKLHSPPGLPDHDWNI